MIKILNYSKLFLIFLTLCSCSSGNKKEEDINPATTYNEITLDFRNTMSNVNANQGDNNKNTLFNMFINENSSFEELSSENIYFDQGGIRFGTSGGAGKINLTSISNINKAIFTVAAHTKISDYYSGADKNSYVKLNEKTSEVLPYSLEKQLETDITLEIVPSKMIELSNIYPISQTELDNKEYGRFILYSVTFFVENVT